ncbi:MAG: MMPL family transporter [Arcobacteraceae bacterium]|nr:MMPL family transporter [Arcobacteraceae bacterium]
MLENFYSKYIIPFPKTVLFLVTICIVILGSFALKLEIDASAETLLLEGDKDLEFSRQISKQYKMQNFLVVTFKPKDELLSTQSINTIQNISDDLLKLELTESVTSIINVPLLQSPPKPVKEFLKDIPTLLSNGTSKELAKKEFLTSPIYKNHLVSSDFKTTALLVNLKDDKTYTQLLNARDELVLKKRNKTISPEESAQLKITKKEFKAYRDKSREETHQNIIKVRQVLEKYKNQAELNLGGVSMIADDMVSFVKYDLETFSVVVILLLVIVLFILLKELRWVLIPILICIISIVSTSGILGLFSWEITVISSNFISLQLIMTMSLVIHLTIKYKELLTTKPNFSQKQLALHTVVSMAKPSFFVIVTTIAGFSSLVFSGILPVINFGWMMSVGIAISLFITFLVFPAIMVLLNKSTMKIKKSKHKPFTSRIANVAYNNQKLIIIGAVLTIIFSLTGASKLFVENSFIDYFKKDTEIYKGMKEIDQNLGGTTPLDVILTFKDEDKVDLSVQTSNTKEIEDEELDSFDDEYAEDENDETYWFTAAKMEKVRQVHNYLESLPQIGKVLSLSTMGEIGKILNNGKYLDSFELALLNKKLPQEYKDILLSPYVNIEQNQARITMRIIDSLPDLRRDDLIKKINRDLNEMLNSKNEEFKLSNLLILYNNMLQSLFDSQISTLGFVIAILFIMFLILFRSLPIAIIALIANIIPVGMIFGFMGWMGIPLDMMTITIAAISIGIAVDDTIHYIHRFKQEFAKTNKYKKAMFNTHKSIGTAMFYTSVIIMIGFSVLVLSNFIPTIYFGLLTLLAMFMAIVADLLLLPVLLIVFKPIKQTMKRN